MIFGAKSNTNISRIRSKYGGLKRLNRDLKDDMNVQMCRLKTNEKLIQLLAAEIAENEHQNQLLLFEQSKELKAICSQQQLIKFERLVKEIRDFFRPDNQPFEK